MPSSPSSSSTSSKTSWRSSWRFSSRSFSRSSLRTCRLAWPFLLLVGDHRETRDVDGASSVTQGALQTSQESCDSTGEPPAQVESHPIRRAVDAGEGAGMRLMLVISYSGGSEAVELEGTPAERPVVVGRGAGATVMVPVPSVSSKHCHLWLDGESWFAQDAGSRAGTLVNGELLSGGVAMALQEGDVIALGASPGAPSLQVRYSESMAAVSPPA